MTDVEGGGLDLGGQVESLHDWVLRCDGLREEFAKAQLVTQRIHAGLRYGRKVSLADYEQSKVQRDAAEAAWKAAKAERADVAV